MMVSKRMSPTSALIIDTSVGWLLSATQRPLATSFVKRICAEDKSRKYNLSQNCLFTRGIPYTQSDYKVSRRRGGQGFALDEERTAGYPYTRCDRHSDPIFVPDDDTGGLHKRLLRRDGHNDKEQKTYMRSTSKKEAAARAM